MTDNCRKYSQNQYTQAYNPDGSRRTMLRVGLEESGKRKKKISAENENNFQAVQKEKKKKKEI